MRTQRTLQARGAAAKRRLAAASALAAATLVLGANALAGEALGRDEIGELLSGNTVRITGVKSKREFHAFYAKDGRVFLKSGELQDTGTWELEPDGRLCTTWKSLRGGQRGCFDVHVIDGQVWFYVAGTDVASAGQGEVTPGDPRNLASN